MRSRSRLPWPAVTSRPVSPPVRFRWPSTRLANDREKVRVTIPVKITPSERRTAIQLSNPPSVVVSAVASAIPAAMGSPARSQRMAEV
jgi:hypothetical protein